METKKLTFGSVLTVAGTYLAFAIGSGFATGQEILQYFYGIRSRRNRRPDTLLRRGLFDELGIYHDRTEEAV